VYLTPFSGFIFTFHAFKCLYAVLGSYIREVTPKHPMSSIVFGGLFYNVNIDPKGRLYFSDAHPTC
jgi:hypothetical protein